MSAADHWMRFNVGDYLADTMHLSTFQHGLYVLLIMHYFKRGELPEDDRALARIAKVSMPQWHRQSAPVMALFARQNGHWNHRRIDAERVRAKNISEIKQAAGKQGASRRWNMAHANGGDGMCHSSAPGVDSRDHARARATEPEPDAKHPPFNPPDGGTRTRRKNGVNGSEPRNGFTASILADMQETSDAEADDARPGGATVVPISRRALSG